jgi:hypothetical protein
MSGRADLALRECAAFILVKNRHVLAEKRKLTKRLAPGAVALPGGHYVRICFEGA